MKYVKSLDGIRAVAIILVMLFHFYFLLEVGWIGVQLFFVLSGYLITSILLESKDSSLPLYLKRFYWRRSLRIFPLYFLYLGAVGLLFIIAKQPPDFISKLPYLLVYNYNHYPLFHSIAIDTTFTHFWSLSLEEQFYLVWPIIIFYSNNRSLQYLLVAIIFLCPIARYLSFEWLQANNYPSADLGQIVYRLTTSQLDGFAFGALIPLFKLKTSEILSSRISIISSILFVLLGAFNLFTTNIPLSSLGYMNGGVENYQYIWSYTIINFFSLGLILAAISTSGLSWLKKILEQSVFIQIGKVSYGMYVYHWIFLAAYRKTIHPFIGYRPLSFIVYLVSIFIISWLSFRFFENYFINLKGKYFNRNNLHEAG